MLALAAARARGGPEDLVPVRRADPEAAGVVLEVVAHVALAQHPAEPPARAEVVDVVVEHVVRQIAGEEPGSQPGRVTAPNARYSSPNTTAPSGTLTAGGITRRSGSFGCS